MALLTTEDVLNKKFQYVKFREGYDQVEVDEFLDEVVSTIYALQMENQDLKEKLEAAERRVAELSDGEFKAPAQPAAPAPPVTTFTAPGRSRPARSSRSISRPAPPRLSMIRSRRRPSGRRLENQAGTRFTACGRLRGWPSNHSPRTARRGRPQ